MGSRILITGATGNVGYELLKCFQKSDEMQVDAGVRDANASLIELGNVNKVTFDFTDSNTYQSLFLDYDKVFLIRPPAISEVKKYFKPIIDSMVAGNVNHVVFLSLQGAESNSVVPHHKIEKLLLKAGLPYTFLRPSFFMQNLTTTHLKEIRDNNEIFIPAGSGKTNFIDVRDIALAAHTVLSNDGHTGKSYELTGPESLDYFQIAEKISSATGKNILYKKPGIISFFMRKRREGYPIGFILVMIALYSVSRFGLAGKESSDLSYLLKKAPISFDQFVKDHAQVWIK